MMNLCFLLATLSINVVQRSSAISLEEQTFVVEPENQTVTSGSKTILPCKIRNKSGILQWTMNDFGLGIRRHLPGYDRYRMIGDDKDGNFSLEIFPTTLEDEGKYQCQVSAGQNGEQPLRSKFAWISVVIPPEPPIILQALEKSVLNVFEGQEVTLDCVSVGGRPSPEIIWLDYQGNVINENLTYIKKPFLNGDQFTTTSTFRMIAKKNHNNAVFTCQAENGAEKPNPAANITLNVFHSPKITVNVKLGSEFSGKNLRGADAILIRQARGELSEEYKWYMGTKLIFDENKERAKQIPFYREFHYVDVNCSVNLISEEIESFFRLNMSGGPDFFWKIQDVHSINEMNGNNVTLVCEAEGNPLPEVFWVDGNTDKVVNRSNTLTVDYNAVGIYYCTASIKVKDLKIIGSSTSMNDFTDTIIHQFGASGNVARVECFIKSIPSDKSNSLIFYNVYPNGTTKKYVTREEHISSHVKKSTWVGVTSDVDVADHSLLTPHSNEMNLVRIWFKSKKEFLLISISLGVILFFFTLVLMICLPHLFRKKNKSNSFPCKSGKKLCLNDDSKKQPDCKLELVTEIDDHSDTDFLPAANGKNGFFNEIDVASFTLPSVETFGVSSRKNVIHIGDKFKLAEDRIKGCPAASNMVNINDNYVPYVDFSRIYRPTGSVETAAQLNYPSEIVSDAGCSIACSLNNTKNAYLNALDCLLPENLKPTIGNPPLLPYSTVWQGNEVANEDQAKKFFKGSFSHVPKKMALL